MKDGFIKIYRSMFDNFLWTEKPFSRAQAWIDLLQMANISDGKVLIKGTVYEVHRGQVFRATSTLAERWGWSRKKVVNFLTLLENEKMATTKGTTGGTLITIENYAVYNTLGAESGTTEGTLEEQQRDSQGTSKKKNKKNKKNKNIGAEDWINEIVPEELRPAFLEWSAMRNKIKKPITSRLTVQRAYNSLVRLSRHPTKQIRIVNQSVDRCWAGFYELKDQEPVPRYKELDKVGPVKAEPMTDEQRANRDKILQEIKNVF